jgi:CRP/FNR family transcriptional regulator, anaerobic regulatory protein
MDQQIDFQRLREYTGRFMTFAEDDLQAFFDCLVKKNIPKGDYLMQAGQVCDYVAFINKGHFRSFCMINNEEATYNFFFDGNFITDYSSFLSRQPSMESHQALEDAEVLMISYEKIQMLYSKIPSWDKFGRLIAEFIILGVAQRNRAMLFMSPEEHYLSLMKTRPKVIANVPLHYIASYLGIQPESLSRIRKRLAEAKRL